MNSVFYLDDKQIIAVECTKRYADASNVPYTEISLQEVKVEESVEPIPTEPILAEPIFTAPESPALPPRSTAIPSRLCD